LKNEEKAKPMGSMDSWRRCDTPFLQEKNGNGLRTESASKQRNSRNQRGGGRIAQTNKEATK